MKKEGTKIRRARQRNKREKEGNSKVPEEKGEQIKQMNTDGERYRKKLQNYPIRRAQTQHWRDHGIIPKSPLTLPSTTVKCRLELMSPKTS